jgi:Myotubularin-like phosphatase domain
VQIFLDPYARTIRGFCSLVAKEWCSFGHKFMERAGHMLDKDDGDVSPVFIQFLDAVSQLVRLFPAAFEFNGKLPLLIAHHTYSCRFGTFLCNNERERAEANLTLRTGSLWHYILSDAVLRPLLSRNYRPEAGDVLLPHPAAVLRSVSLWQEWFLRYATYPSLAPVCNNLESYGAVYDRAALAKARQTLPSAQGSGEESANSSTAASASATTQPQLSQPPQAQAEAEAETEGVQESFSAFLAKDDGGDKEGDD